MRLFMPLLAGALCLASVPVMAAAADVPPAPTAEVLSAKLSVYGAWLGQLQKAEEPAMAAFPSLGPAWDVATRGAPSRQSIETLRLKLTQLTQLIDRTSNVVAALPLPDIDGLPLPPDVMPRQLQQEMVALNGQMHVAIVSFNPLLDAVIRHDQAAGVAAVGRLVRNVKLIFDSQALFTRAQIASSPPDTATRYALGFTLGYLRAMSRVLDSTPGAMKPHIDLALARDLDAIAVEVDDQAQKGSVVLEAQLARYRETAARAQEAGDAARAALLQKVIRVADCTHETFELSHQFTAILRDSAKTIRTTPLTTAVLDRLTDKIRVIKAGLLRIDVEQARLSAQS
jgi:hypothetical protein